MNRLLIHNALVFATDAHAGQVRKYTGVPYVFHTMEVANIIAEDGGLGVTDPEILAAAILHDVVEDTFVEINEVRQVFGTDVATLVDEMTEVVVPGNRRIRKAAEVERLAGISDRGQTIKLADLISNTRTIAKHDPGFAQVYLREKRAILDAMTGGLPVLRDMAEAQWEAAVMQVVPFGRLLRAKDPKG